MPSVITWLGVISYVIKPFIKLGATQQLGIMQYASSWELRHQLGYQACVNVTCESGAVLHGMLNYTAEIEGMLFGVSGLFVLFVLFL